MLESEKRGGRVQVLREKDETLRAAILSHINRFPRMESHYCRLSTSKEYLHPDLTISKMNRMFNNEFRTEGLKSSFFTYRDVFKKCNLAIHHAKKDQCSLCIVYRTGDSKKKEELEQRYKRHIAEKQAVREWKSLCKDLSLTDKATVCSCFDLQQVILLPISNESQLFYHRRLSNFNLTVYNTASKDCECYLWHEGLSKRGSSEISTCLYKYLMTLDLNNIEEVFLFSDGCSGQNKNSAIATMLLHVVLTSKNIRMISLRFFEPYHGQNEGDSAHSAIQTSISAAGDLFVPSQLIPVIRLARHKKPYIVQTLESQDFLDFKGMAKDLRILSVRQDDNGKALDWPSMAEFMVLKHEPDKVFFKSSHLEDEYRSITLPRKVSNPSCKPKKLNNKTIKLSEAKYNDLISLCSGQTPLIRNQEHINFYKNLPH